MRIVYFGTPAFAAEVLRHLLKHHIEVVAVISKPDKPLGRSNKLLPVPVKLVAEEWGIPIYQPEKVSAETHISHLISLKADLFVVVAYGEILKQHVLDIPKKACINLHASLLPKYRGAAPIQQAIIQGEVETGITIMHMVKKMDAGDIIFQTKVPITEEMNYGELSNNLQSIGAEALLKVIRQFDETIPSRVPQNELFATFAPKIELEDCRIDWRHSAQEIHNLIRGVNPEPGSWCDIRIGQDVKRLKIFRAILSKDKKLVPGQIAADSKRLFVGCGEDCLALQEVQLEGKRRMTAMELYRGLSGKNIEFVVDIPNIPHI